MALKNNLLLSTLIYFSLFSQLYGKIELHELLTKQEITNIRLITKDGKFTYYQKRSGDFLLSTSYKVNEILKGIPGTDYEVFSTFARKKILITQNFNKHDYYSIRGKLKIFVTDFGGTVAKEIGAGVNPQLHSEDNWVTYFDPFLKKIHIENIENKTLHFSIKLNNEINPYFVPNIVMSNNDLIYYTDLNEEGIPGLFEFNKSINKSSLLYKGESSMEKIELLNCQGALFFGTFGIKNSNLGSKIFKVDFKNFDFQKKEIIYSSENNDSGNLQCLFNNNEIAFIKNTGIKNIKSEDVFKYNFLEKKIFQLSDLKTVTNYINMDGLLLIQDKGKYLVIDGETDYKSIDNLNYKKESKP